MWGLRLLSALLLVLALCVIGYPMVLQYQSDVRLAHTTSAAAERVAGWPYPQAEESLAAARAYNERLAASGQPILGEAHDPFSAESGGSRASGEDSASAQDEEYQSLLDAGGGVMGAIRIPEISVDLPIYHGTSESALASGAGHLYGSSLPVGGESTHSVITGHRGMVEAMMFTRLDEMKVGDYFYIDVMGETLGYRVDRIEVIEPDDTSRLKTVEGEDRVTLMTCTPYGVNTHRLLVSGVRRRSRVTSRPSRKRHMTRALPRRSPYPARCCHCCFWPRSCGEGHGTRCGTGRVGRSTGRSRVSGDALLNGQRVTGRTGVDLVLLTLFH